MKKKVVIALGHRALGTTLPEQMVAVKRSAKYIADLVEEGYQVAVCHSNTPQMGMIHTAMNEFGKAHENYTAAPMSVCSAMSQGYIGYDLQNAIREELLNRGIFRTVSTVLTQVLVDPYDDAFYQPTKIIGRCLTEEEAKSEEEKGNHVTKTADGYRRIVSAPKPVDIIEIDAINVLLDANQIVIACGGGGIPVLKQGHALKGASAVIEKDLAAGKLAELVHADELIFLTSVEHVVLDLNTDHETNLESISTDEAQKYISDDQFGKTSMLPKIEASVDFIKKGKGRQALITSYDKLKEALKGQTGTLIK